jgi:hypothetical protein
MSIQLHIKFISLILFLLYIEIKFIYQYIYNYNFKYDLFHIIYAGIFLILVEYTYFLINYYSCFLYKIYKINNITYNIIYFRSDIDVCSICLNNYIDNDLICQIKCFHIYHKSCIDTWINSSGNLTCPICREELIHN